MRSMPVGLAGSEDGPANEGGESLLRPLDEAPLWGIGEKNFSGCFSALRLRRSPDAAVAEALALSWRKPVS